MTIDEKALAEYEALTKRTANGPWEVHRFDKASGFINYQVQQAVEPGEVISNVWDNDVKSARSTSRFIAASRTMGPALCAALRAERATIVRLRAGLSALRDRFRDEDYRAMCIIDEAMRDAETAQSAKGGES